MSNQVIVVKPNLPALPHRDHRVSRQYRREIQHIASIADVTKVSMEQIGETTTVASFEAYRTLATISLFERSDNLSPGQKDRLEQLKTSCCEAIERLTEIHNAKIVFLIEHLPPVPEKTLWDELVDFVSG